MYGKSWSKKKDEEDLYQLFGLKSTKYLSENSYIEFVMDEPAGKSKSWFVTVSTHVSEEIIKLNGLEFTDKTLL